MYVDFCRFLYGRYVNKNLFLFNFALIADGGPPDVPSKDSSDMEITTLAPLISPENKTSGNKSLNDVMAILKFRKTSPEGDEEPGVTVEERVASEDSAVISTASPDNSSFLLLPLVPLEEESITVASSNLFIPQELPSLKPQTTSSTTSTSTTITPPELLPLTTTSSSTAATTTTSTTSGTKTSSEVVAVVTLTDSSVADESVASVVTEPLEPKTSEPAANPSESEASTANPDDIGGRAIVTDTTASVDLPFTSNQVTTEVESTTPVVLIDAVTIVFPEQTSVPEHTSDQPTTETDMVIFITDTVFSSISPTTVMSIDEEELTTILMEAGTLPDTTMPSTTENDTTTLLLGVLSHDNTPVMVYPPGDSGRAKGPRVERVPREPHGKLIRPHFLF